MHGRRPSLQTQISLFGAIATGLQRSAGTTQLGSARVQGHADEVSTAWRARAR